MDRQKWRIEYCLNIIKARLDKAKGAGLDKVPSVLWVYWTTVKTPTRETSFNLTYGTKVVIPVEIGVIRPRREFFFKEANNDQLE